VPSRTMCVSLIWQRSIAESGAPCVAGSVIDPLALGR
jgi:hypothetical protein